jgi:hypothetical protein
LLLPLDSNYWWLGSTSQLLPSLWMAPSLDTYLSPGLVAWCLASWPLINLVVEQKL